MGRGEQASEWHGCQFRISATLSEYRQWLEEPPEEADRASAQIHRWLANTELVEIEGQPSPPRVMGTTMPFEIVMLMTPGPDTIEFALVWEAGDAAQRAADKVVDHFGQRWPTLTFSRYVTNAKDIAHVVRTTLKRIDKQQPPRRGGPKPTPDHVRHRIILGWLTRADGTTQAPYATSKGVSTSTLRRWLREFERKWNLSPEPKGHWWNRS